MNPDNRFYNLKLDFWANIRTISEGIRYSGKENLILIPSINDIKKTFSRRRLDYSHVVDNLDQLSDFGRLLISYLEFRANILNNFVEKSLMDIGQAKSVFEELRETLNPTCPIPMNRQKGTKKAPAYFTGIINMIIEANSKQLRFDYNPRQLTIFTKDNKPLRTSSRKIYGAFPSSINPVSIWEIKEYYYSTTFGHRISDGFYESLLDGMELEELRINEKIEVMHLLMVDSHYTWWVMGKAYLCHMIDMLHMGYVDKILFGNEVVEKLPDIVKGWIELVNN